MFSAVFNRLDWDLIISDFTKCVSSGHYNKMSYNIWKELAKSHSHSFVVEEWEGNPHELVITDESFHEWSFKINDNSFGQYLWENVDISNRMWKADYMGNDIYAAKDNKIKDEKENEKMKGFNFDFGPCNSNTVRMSMYGMAVKSTSGPYVSYDVKNETIMDVDVFNFDGAKFLYKIPVAIKDIKVGDVVIHAHKPMFVTGIGATNKTLIVVDPVNGEKKEIMLTRSPFGFDFATKIVNLFESMGVMNGSANADNPFGNMWMFMMMNDNGTMSEDMIPFMFMTNQNSGTMNPMMMYFMMKGEGKEDSSWLPFMMMMNQGENKSGCTCGGHCGEHNN